MRLTNQTILHFHQLTVDGNQALFWHWYNKFRIMQFCGETITDRRRFWDDKAKCTHVHFFTRALTLYVFYVQMYIQCKWLHLCTHGLVRKTMLVCCSVFICGWLFLCTFMCVRVHFNVWFTTLLYTIIYMSVSTKDGEGEL